MKLLPCYIILFYLIIISFLLLNRIEKIERVFALDDRERYVTISKEFDIEVALLDKERFSLDGEPVTVLIVKKNKE